MVSFHTSSRKSQNLPFDQILLSKACKDLYEKVQKSFVSWQGRVICKVWRKTNLWFQICMRNLANFYQTTQKSKNFTLMGYFCPKYMRFELKSTKELFFMTLNNDAKSEYTLTLCFQNWHKELGELSLQHPKIWKIVHWWALFVQSI